MDKYHETNPPTRLKREVLGEAGSRKGKVDKVEVTYHAGMPPAGTPVPPPLYSCSNANCAEEQSYPAEDLFWSWKREGWYCRDCWSRGLMILDEETPGVSLAGFLNTDIR